MKNGFKIALLFFIILCFSYSVVNYQYTNDLEERIEQLEKLEILLDTECERILFYEQLGRPQFLCYVGEGRFYTNNEKRVINQWKNQK